MRTQRDHGGGLDAAAQAYGGPRDRWMDLSTGINPHPYPFTPVKDGAWTALPDSSAQSALIDAARTFWQVPEQAAILPVPGASAAITQIPRLVPKSRVWIPAPTYNEHAAAFDMAGWTNVKNPATAAAQVLVHPNNPTGYIWQAADLAAPFRIIDESFCDVCPDNSLMSQAATPGTLVLKSFGKFWGLAGLRLGFVIGDAALVADLAEMLGPWPVSGIALQIGTQALQDVSWTDNIRKRLFEEATRLDDLMKGRGAALHGGTTLFRLYRVDNAAAWQNRLARHQIWSRVFPYDATWLRLGLPPSDGWDRLEAAV